MTDVVVGVRLKADGSGLVGEIKISEKAFADLKAQAAAAGAGMNDAGEKGKKAARETKAEVGGMESAWATAKTAVLGYISAVAAIALAREFIQQADAMQMVNSRLALATKGADELRAVQKDLFALAQKNGAAYTEQAQAFARISPMIREMGGGAKEALKITEILTLSARLSGAASEEAAASTRQFVQALGSGVLQGDELRSILENNQRLARALAEGLGVSVAQLKQLGSEGKLTADKLLTALTGQLGTLRAEAEKLPPTFEQAAMRLKNALAQSTNAMNQKYQVTRRLGDAVTWLADNLDLVGKTVMVLATAVMVMLLPQLIAAVVAINAVVIAHIAWAAALMREQAAMTVMAFQLSTLTGAKLLLASATNVLSAALALVGGPIGVIVIALGALAYAAFNAKDSLKELAEADPGEGKELDHIKKIDEAISSLTGQLETLAATGGIDGMFDYGESAKQNYQQIMANLTALTAAREKLEQRIVSRGNADGLVDPESVLGIRVAGAAASKIISSMYEETKTAVQKTQDEINKLKSGLVAKRREMEQEIADMTLKGIDASQVASRAAKYSQEIQQGVAAELALSKKLRHEREAQTKADQGGLEQVIKQIDIERDARVNAAQRTAEAIKLAVDGQTAYVQFKQKAGMISELEMISELAGLKETAAKAELTLLEEQYRAESEQLTKLDALRNKPSTSRTDRAKLTNDILTSQAKMDDLVNKTTASEERLNQVRAQGGYDLLLINKKQLDDLTSLARLTDDAIRGYQDAADAQQFQLDLIGKTAVEVARLTELRRIDADIVKQTFVLGRALQDAMASGKTEKELLEIYDLHNAILTVLNNQRAVMPDIAAGIVTAREESQKWLNIWNSLGDAVGKFFSDLVVNGRRAFDNLKASLKSFFQEFIALMAKKWVLNLVANAAGAGGFTTIANAATTASNLAGQGSTAGTLYNGASSWFGGSGGGGSGFTSQTAGGMYTLPGEGGTGVASLGEQIASMGPAIIAGILGGLVGRFGARALGAGDRGVQVATVSAASLAAIGMQVYGPIGAAIGAVIGLLIGKFTDPKGLAQRTAQFGTNPAGNYSMGGGTTSAFGTFGTFNDKWFSDKDMGEQMKHFLAGIKMIDDALAATMTRDQIDRVKAALAAVSKTYDFGIEHGPVDGLGAILKDRLTIITREISPVLEALVIAFEGTSDALVSMINDWLAIREITEIIKSSNIAGITIEGIQALRAEGESFAATFQRIIVTFAATSMFADEAFKAVGLATQAAREQLIQFAGGLEAWAKNQDNYFKLFHTPAEQTAALMAGITAQFAAVNVVLPSTRAGYRAMVEALDLSTEAGRRQYVVLTNSASAADAYYTALEQGAAAAASAIAEAIAEAARIAADALQKLKDRIASVQSFIAGIQGDMQNIRAAQPGFNAVGYWQGQVANRSQTFNAATTTEARIEAGGQLRQAILSRREAERTAVQRAHGERIAQINRERDAIKQAGEARIQAEKAALDAARQSMQQLKDALRQIGEFAKSLLLSEFSPLTDRQRLDESGTQYAGIAARAKGGDLAAVGQYTGGANAYLKELKNYYAVSSDEYQAAFRRVQQDATALGLQGDAMNFTAFEAQSLTLEREQNELDRLMAEFDARVALEDQLLQARLIEIDEQALTSLQGLSASMDVHLRALQTTLAEQLAVQLVTGEAVRAISVAVVGIQTAALGNGAKTQAVADGVAILQASLEAELARLGRRIEAVAEVRR